MYISLNDLGLFIVFCVVLIGGVFFTIAIFNLNKLIKKLNILLDKNSTNLDNTMIHLPQLITNTNDAMKTVKSGFEKVQCTIDEIEETIAETVVAVSEKADNIGIYYNTFTDLVKIFADMFVKSAKK